MTRMLDPILGPAPPLPAATLDDHLDADAFTGWKGEVVDVTRMYETLTELGWKVDREESNLMCGMSRVWRDAGVKAWLWLNAYACAPPDGETAPLEALEFYRFDPAAMPTTTMAEQMYEPGDEDEPWYPSHREEWDWLVTNGDPQYDTFELLTRVKLREVPRAILDEAWLDLEEALRRPRP